MGCNCGKRGVAIVKAVTSLSKGEGQKTMEQVKIIGRTFADDAANIRQRVSAARQSMMRR